jgi:hypothetical protein
VIPKAFGAALPAISPLLQPEQGYTWVFLPFEFSLKRTCFSHRRRFNRRHNLEVAC